jgi:hypothetical protein
MTERQAGEFIARVEVGTCYTWTGTRDTAGSPDFTVRPRLLVRSPKKLVYMACQGEVPAGMVVKNTCGNRLCVNPAHLSVVPRKKEKAAPAPERRLSLAEVQRILAARESGETIKSLAARFSVSTDTIRATIKGDYEL